LNAIADFDCNRGDRIGFRATLDGNSLFSNRGWIFINARPFTAAGRAEPRFTMAGRLLGADDGDGRAELRILLLRMETFAPSGSAEPEAEGSLRIGAVRTVMNGCTRGVLQPEGSGLTRI
jgi:hypothetical protein